jgi:bla regulator protein BlaR1
MITYFLKIILCSALLLLFYFLFLEKEKMLRFNRAYLLSGIFLSFIIPFMSLSTEIVQNILPIEQFDNAPSTNIQEIIATQVNTPPEEHNYFTIAGWTIYLTVTIFLFARLTRNIFNIYHKIKTNKAIPYHGAKLVLVNDNVVPHSFLQYIFINKNAIEQSAIEKEILGHELTHVTQKHSLDILFLELLLVFFWFNPFLFLYRRCIKLNHEFLADDAVIKRFNDTAAYQYLLLERSNQPASLSLNSEFNYLLTKKRLIMMTRTTSKRIALLKKLALLPIIGLAIFLFSTKTIAQKPAKLTPQSKMEVSSTVEGASLELMNEYATIVAKHKPGPNEVSGKPSGYYKDITDAERDRLETIFLQMNKTQQAQQEIFFMPPIPPFRKSVPTSAQLQSWVNAKKYGVWIDEKRVANSILSKYSVNDFSHAFVSQLSKNAVNYGKHYVQVNLMTNAYYKNYFDQANANKKNSMLMRRFKNNVESRYYLR